MTVDDQIRDVLAAEPLGAPPTASERAAVDRAATAVRRRRVLARGGMAAMLTTVVVVLAVVAWPKAPVEVQTGGTGSPEAVGPGDAPDGWTTIVEPALGWTMSFPEGWKVASVSDQCRIGEASTIVASAGEPPPYREYPNRCTTGRDWNAVPRDAVLIGISYRPERFAAMPGTSVPVPDTPPLTAPPDSDFHPQEDASFLSQASQQVVVDGDDGYWATIWFGEEASDEAKAEARLAIGLLRPPPDGALPMPTSTLDPSWRTVALPSVEPLAPDANQVGPLALLSGTLHLEGDCLFVDGQGGTRTLLIWYGNEVHMVIDGDGRLVDVVRDGQSLQPLDPEIRAGGGYYQPGMSPRPISNLRDECVTSDGVFIGG